MKNELGIARTKPGESAFAPKLDTFFALAKDILCVAGLDGCFKHVNPAFERTLGYTPEELLETHFADLSHPDDRERSLAELDALRRGEETIAFSNRFRTKDGVYRLLEWTATVSPEGYVYAVAQDLTDRRQREQALETRYRTLFDQAPDAIVLFDLDEGRFVDVNRVAETLFKMSREELLKVGPVDVSPPFQPDGRPSHEVARQRIADALDGAIPRFEWMHRDSEGKNFLCEVNVMQMSVNRRIVRGSIIDITEQRRMEEELQQSRKMEAVGQLAGGVAHDFNNLLMVIDGYAAAALDKLAEDSDVTADVKEIRNASARAATLTSQLLAFSRKQVIEPRVLDLNCVVETLAGMLRRVIGENIRLTTILDDSLPPVEFDPGQIEQIIINLAVNARDAMPDGGRLDLFTRRMPVGERRVAIPPPPSGEYVVLTVADDGRGMPADVQAHVFEPFFTTKDSGRGTGLGLSTVYGIVTQNGGWITLKSEPGRGTTFDIFLPATDKHVAPEATLSDRVHDGDETILVAEDEEPLRVLLVEILRRRGYEVLDAADGEEALRVAERHAGRIDLVIADVVMPERSGPDLTGALTGRRPETEVLFLSGYADDLLPTDVHRPGVHFLQKPVPPSTLARRVREILDGRGSGA